MPNSEKPGQGRKKVIDMIKGGVNVAKKKALPAVLAVSTLFPAGNALAGTRRVADLNTPPTTSMVEKVSSVEIKDPQDAAELNKLSELQRRVYESVTYYELQAIMNLNAEDGAQLNKLTVEQLALYNSTVYQDLQAMNLPPVEAQDGATLNSYTPAELAQYEADMNNLDQNSIAKKN
jgi:hypothetical protein